MGVGLCDVLPQGCSEHSATPLSPLRLKKSFCCARRVWGAEGGIGGGDGCVCVHVRGVLAGAVHHRGMKVTRGSMEVSSTGL